jgi:putative nucleotidyltransferase with HDIG domain
METIEVKNSLLGTIIRKINRPTLAAIYTGFFPIVGLVIVFYTFFHLPNDLAGLCIFILLGAIAELTSIELFSRSTVSMSSIIAIASIVAIGPIAGALTYLASGLTTAITTSLRQKSTRERATLFQRTSFNAGMWVIAGFFAGQMYVLVGGIPGDVVQWSSIPALTVATGVEWLVNALILVGVISLNSRKHPLEIWKQDIGWQAPVSVLSGVIGGGMLALAYSMFNMLGVLVVLLPVLSTSYAFRVYKNNMKEYVDGLEKLNVELKEAMVVVEETNLDLKEANQAVQRLNNELFQSLAEVFDMRDPYVGGHAAQVAKYAVAIATEMGFPADRIETIRQSAFLHDIGKLAVPEAILHKPGKLTDIEYDFIKKHSDIGYELLNATEGLKHLAPFVRHHHERWDGGGYPLGLAGEQIPLEARILNVCDSVESMASDRPYHRGMSVDEITAEVQRCAGSQFDPMVAEVFERLVQKHGATFVVNSARSVTQQFAASMLANESLTHSMFAWVLEREAQKYSVNGDA